MVLPKQGAKLNLTVAAAFPHHPGQSKRSTGKLRGKGKPSLELKLEALPMNMQLQLKSVVPKTISMIDSFSPLVSGAAMMQGVTFNGGTIVQSVLDTGASRCVMSTDDAIRAFSTTIKWALLPEDSVSLPNGARVSGKVVWMRVQVQRAGSPFFMSFVVSNEFQTPILISWRAISRKFRFVLAADHIAVCE